MKVYYNEELNIICLSANNIDFFVPNRFMNQDLSIDLRLYPYFDLTNCVCLGEL